MQRTTHLSECVADHGKYAFADIRASAWHLDLACQVQADIQMLYYYITFQFKMQGLSENFFAAHHSRMKCR